MNKKIENKFLKKTIATMLLFVMVFQFVPNIVIAINQTTKDEETLERMNEHIKKTTEENAEKEPTVIGELEDQRTLNEKHFLMSDGTILATIFPNNIHYEKEGKLLDVDNTLEEVLDQKETLRKTDDVDTNENSNISEKQETNTKIEDVKTDIKIFRNKTGNAKINFTNKTDGFNIGSMESDGHKITWGLLGSKTSNVNIKEMKTKANKIKGQKAKDIEINIPQTTVEYGNILDNINIKYSLEPEHVKEDIILNNSNAINNALVFTYDIGTLKMKQLETKDIIVYDENEENVIFTIKAPFMYDSNLETSNDIEVYLEEQNGKYLVTIVPDKNWLEETSRIYPVVIDPSILTSRYYQDIQDTFIYSTQGNNPKGNAHIFRAGNDVNVPDRSLIKFDLPELKAGDQIIGAYLNIFSYPKTTEWTPPTRQIQLDVHKMTSDWDETTAVWSNANSNYEPRIEDYILYQFDYNNQCKQYNFNITSVAKEWYTTGNNYGVMIKEHMEANNSTENNAYFISADTTSAWYEGRPVVQIIYRNQTGLEDYLSYHVQNLGRAGTVYTNDYNGNLTWVHEDISTPGVRMPVTIKHIYNTNDKDTNLRFGKGVRLNISQTIKLVTIGAADYAEYTDEDGTRHYFTKESAYTYKDEDGLGLELTLDTTSVMFIMKDKGDNILRFERRMVAGEYLWHLKEIEDNNGNKTVISFLDTISDQFIIVKVTDAAGQAITFQYSGYYLSKLIGPDGKIIEYTYGSTGILDNIKYPDGLRTYYDFSNNVLNALQKIDGSLIKYQYYPDKTKRVKKISEYANDAVTVGNSMDITYSNNLTTFTDNQGYSNNVTFNDWGQAISVADFGKGAQNFKEAYGKVYNYGTSGGSKNKLTLDGNLTKSVNNLLINGSAEYDGEWVGSNWGLNQGTYCMTTEEKYSGNRSLKLTNPAQGSYYTFYAQTLAIPKGKTYTFSVKAKTVNLTSNEGGQLFVYYYNENGELVRPQSEYIQNTNGWQEYSFTFTYPANATSDLYVCLGLMGCKGSIYFDDAQLEEGTIANKYNMIENSAFDYPGNNSKKWTTFNAPSMWDSVATVGTYNLFRLYGDTSKRKGIYQNIITSGKAGDTFSVSAWVYAGGTRAKGNTCNTIAINVIAPDNTEQWLSVGINPSNQWQFVQHEFVANHDYKMIQVYFCFYENVNEAYITNISLFKDEFGQSYQYDSKGNLIKTQDLAKQQNTFNYDGNDNLIEYTNPKGGTFEYQYDTTYKHRLTKAISSAGINYNFEYNQYGEATNSKVKNNIDSQYIETKAEYTANGNYLTKLTDEKENETNYEYNQTTGTLTKVTDAKNNIINYTYDTLNRIQTARKTANGQNYQNSYTYANDRLNTITHNGFSYSFIYDKFGNTSQVKVGSQTLITNNYATNNGLLTSATYGNNQQISYTYDRFNRMITQTKTQGTYQYEYDAKSNLAYSQSPEGIKTYYTYDLADRLVKVNNTTYNFTRSYTYDQNNNINSKKYKLGNATNEINYTFDKNNRITNLNLNNNINVVTNYDTLSRIANKQLKVGTNTYTTQYNYGNLGNNKTTTSISSITNGTNNISYTYDNLGNIQTITEGSILKATYHYDELNQLIREDNSDLSKTIIYTYNLGGNITTKTEYPYTTENLGTATNTINYSYTNTNWKDQLTSYNGQAITYDAIGNPIIYNGNNYTWQNGRELAQIVNGTNTYQYKYNDEGIRIEKNVNGVVTRYHTEGTKVIYEKKDGSNDVIYYSYDESGNIIGLKYNNTQYYYIKNLQGDIIGILDNNLTQVVSYTYDSWGKLISIKDANRNEITDTTNIGLINPYRYRSYRYDTEIGLYYLNSRYYNPEWGRFINADGTMSSGYEILGHNMYVYCNNNCINMCDPDGKLPILAIAIAYVATNALTPVKFSNFANSTIKKLIINDNMRKNIRFAESLPKTGTPNSTKELLNPDGTVKQRRYYGPDGRATRDTDYNHSGKHQFPHDHEWDWNKTPPRQKPKETAKEITQGLIIGGTAYITYRLIRMIPSLLCPLTIIPNAIIP